ncbi:hypothetical protein IFM89_007243 [Coptis chinensis]|uniref:DUF4283 domain-containing protein n=1 Tax=Coptis chinensis TaxID=261450 RepID=A0A835M530_9MAGN|nr:hypothetical protein IFM89_007243 [Coptis chinensis]
MSFPFVKQVLAKKWKTKGEFDMIADSELFYFKFTNEEDKLHVMELGPIYMAGNCFIVTPWSQDVEKRRKTIKGIPIWVNLYDVPKELWSEEGLGVVASRLGRPLLMDEATASKKRISFARVCIEVEISSELPLSFEIEMEKGDNRTVRVEYSWVPKKCDICKAFGHLTDKCFRVPSSTEPATHNARAPRRIWVQRQQEETGEQEPESISENPGNSTNEGMVNTAILEVNQLLWWWVGVEEESNGIEKKWSYWRRCMLEHFVNPEDSVAMEEFEEEMVDFIRRTEGIGDGEMSEDVLSVEETPYFSDKVTEPLAILDTPIQHKNDANRRASIHSVVKRKRTTKNNALNHWRELP